MNKIIMIEDLKNYNNKSDFEQSIDLLRDFLIDENTEVFLKEENAFGINEDFIKCNLHYVAKLDKGKIEIYSNEHPPQLIFTSIYQNINEVMKFQLEIKLIEIYREVMKKN